MRMLEKKNNIHPTIKFLKYFPDIANKVSISSSAKIIGNTSIRKGTKILDDAVIRGDGKKIQIGENCLLKKRSTVHVASDFMGTKIGNNCFIEEFAIIHACSIGNNVKVGENCVVMDGSYIGDYSIILPDTLIPPGKTFEKFSLISGSPAKLIKNIDIKYYNNFNNLKSESKFIFKKYLKKINLNFQSIELDENNTFIAPDSAIGCNTLTKPNSSIWFSTVLYSPDNKGTVYLGKGSNIQDNSIFNTKGKDIYIGDKVTIGHNVIINGAIKVYDNAVIGMGSILEENCIVEKNAFIGANSYVNKNTIVPEGKIYAGNPAKFFRNVTQQEKEFFSLGQKTYEKLTKEYLKKLYD